MDLEKQAQEMGNSVRIRPKVGLKSDDEIVYVYIAWTSELDLR